MEIEPIDILIVSDKPDLCEKVRLAAANLAVRCVTVSTPQQAKQALNSQSFAIMVVCNSVPEISGLELVEHARRTVPGCKTIILSDPCSPGYIVEAFRRGAFQCVSRSTAPDRLAEAFGEALRADSPFRFLPYDAVRAIESVAPPYRAPLQSVCSLMCAVEAKDEYSRRHCEQVAYYAVSLARWLGISEVLVHSIRIASLVHDVGKIAVPDEILTKSGTLTEKEFEQLKVHSAAGAEILRRLGVFPAETQFVRSHHENWDATGYPDGLQGEEIPFGARVIRVADSIDAMLMPRRYRDAYSVDRMLDEIAAGAGKQYDPQLAAAAVGWCAAHKDQFIRVPAMRN